MEPEKNINSNLNKISSVESSKSKVKPKFVNTLIYYEDDSNNNSNNSDEFNNDSSKNKNDSNRFSQKELYKSNSNNANAEEVEEEYNNKNFNRTNKSNNSVSVKNSNYSILESSSPEYKEYRRKLKKTIIETKDKETQLSIKHLIFVIILWVGFVGSLIVGLILHFELSSGVTASSILWSLSIIFCIIASAYTFLYCKIKYDGLGSKKKLYLLKFFPI